MQRCFSGAINSANFLKSIVFLKYVIVYGNSTLPYLPAKLTTSTGVAKDSILISSILSLISDSVLAIIYYSNHLPLRPLSQTPSSTSWR